MASVLQSRVVLPNLPSRQGIEFFAQGGTSKISLRRNYSIPSDYHRKSFQKSQPGAPFSSSQWTRKLQVNSLWEDGKFQSGVETVSSPLTQLRYQALSAAAAVVITAAALFIPSAEAADALKTCTCLVKECRLEFARCLGDVKCAANIACLQTCNNRPDETECQIKCGDLFENSVVDEFNACAVSRKGCVPQKPDENLFPVPPTAALVPEFQPKQFDGKWYISSGLNQTFDTFDCQLHEFSSDGTAMTANLAWRIKTPTGGFFTRNAVQTFVQDPELPGALYNHDNEFLHYQDDWYILAAQTEEKPDDFIFVYYRGKNDAWDGYGGSVIYTRAKVLPESIVPQLREAARNVGLDFDKQFTKTDNTCGPQPPLLKRIEITAENVEKLLLEEVEEVERTLQYIGDAEMKLLEGLKKGITEVERDEERFLQELGKEEREFFDSLKMSASEVEELFGNAIPLRKSR